MTIPGGLGGKHHLGQHRCISAFDSGAITPSVGEQTIGWTIELERSSSFVPIRRKVVDINAARHGSIAVPIQGRVVGGGQLSIA